jgi:hypothetical protein
MLAKKPPRSFCYSAGPSDHLASLFRITIFDLTIGRAAMEQVIPAPLRELA